MADPPRRGPWVNGSIFARFGFSYQSAWAFVNDDGDLRTIFGALDDAVLEEEIRRLLRV